VLYEKRWKERGGKKYWDCTKTQVSKILKLSKYSIPGGRVGGAEMCGKLNYESNTRGKVQKKRKRSWGGVKEWVKKRNKEP